MGFFSWLTADTRESVMNCHTNECRTVYMLQPNGEPPIEEKSYDGYGVFGGVDAYDWLVYRNGIPERLRTEGREKRNIGISMACGDYDLRYPLKFSFDKDAVYEALPKSGDCPRQGFFGPTRRWE